MYLQPDELRPHLLEAMASIPAVAPYFDLSLQHVRARADPHGPRRLAGALRPLIGRIRELAPHAAFRSNFILGFPGETEHDVAQLEDFLDEHELDWVGLFPFSREDGTPSDDLRRPGRRGRRPGPRRRIASVQERIADRGRRAAMSAATLDVLVEEVVELEGEVVQLVGRSPPRGARHRRRGAPRHTRRRRAGPARGPHRPRPRRRPRGRRPRGGGARPVTSTVPEPPDRRRHEDGPHLLPDTDEIDRSPPRSCSSPSRTGSTSPTP